MSNKKEECDAKDNTDYRSDVNKDNWRMILEFFEEIKAGTEGKYACYVMDSA